jgi:hypothetical protein
MWIHTTPSLAMLAIVGWYITRHRGQPVLQVHALITASYLNLFPMLDYLLSDRLGMESFGSYQWLVVMFFQLPLLLVAHAAAGQRLLRTPVIAREPAALSRWLPWLFVVMLIGFWYVALSYDLFFRRLGHEGLQRNTAEVPRVLLYIYRASVETAFFVIIFLSTALARVARRSRHHFWYKWTLVAYAGSFVLFFLANSRMQFILLLLCVFCTQPRLSEYLVRRLKLWRLALLLAALVLGLTLLRELVFEETHRLESDDITALLYAASWLIAERLDSLHILYELDRAGFSAWRFDLTGISHVVSFYASFFFDPGTYNTIKESLITSPSVVMVNRLLNASEIDFPKSMILDMFLSFGVFGLVATAVLLGAAIGRVQRHLSRFSGFSLAFLSSLYALPLLLEFEKEFIGFLFSVVKWLPVLLLVYWQRPRFGHGRGVSCVSAKPSSQTG